ncbi:MAG: response regulator [Candidatus Wallbacteria bacterium]|nr:response regulator [Candidatus Wallbacteria bacterium]
MTGNKGESARERLFQVLEFTRELTSCRSPGKLLGHFCGGARQLIGATASGILVADEVQRLFASSGLEEPFASRLKDEALAPGGLLSALLAGKLPYRTRDLTLDLPVLPTNLASLAEGAFMALPIATSTRNYGLVFFSGLPDAREFVEEDEQLAQGLAAHLAIAFENSRLDDESHLVEGKHRALLEHLPVIMFQGALGQPNPTLYISAQVDRILGYPRAQWLEGEGLWPKVVHHHDRARVLESAGRLQSPGDRASLDYRMVASNGEDVWFHQECAVIGLTATGAPLVDGVLVDITQRKRAEDALAASQEQLRQVQKMEALGQLAGGVAHDFNNLLTVISGYADFLVEGAAEGSAVRHDATVISKTADRAKALTQHLLAFSRKQVLRLRIFNLNTQVVETEKMLRRLIGEDIDLRLDLATDLGPVKADPGQMDQVLINLAVNARDAMPAGGRLTISTSGVTREIGGRPARHVCLSVTDTGQGMDEKTRAKIFEPFFTTKEKGKGTGLGLATVHGIVQQSGGSIEVTSSPGEGSRFDIFLPVAEHQAPDAAAPRSAARRSGGRETLLVVDDDEAVRILFRRTLERCGYQVLVAENGQAALELCRRHVEPIHLVVTDVVMPQLGGAGLVSAMTSCHPETRVLYVSGYTEDAIGQHGVFESGVHLLSKPATPSELARKVREILDGTVDEP